MTIAAFATAGFTSDERGHSGAFSWYRSTTKPGKWYVIAYEQDFSSGGYGVTDDFGNLVRVSA